MKMRLRVLRSDFTLESLERRQVLSTASAAPGMLPPDPGVPAETASASFTTTVSEPVRNATLKGLMAVSPGDGAVLPASDAPSAIIIQLNEQLLSRWTNGSLAIYRIGSQGELAPISDQSTPLRTVRDRANSTVTFPLDGALAPGRYRVVLVGGIGLFSQNVCDGTWDFMKDQTLAEFQVQGAELGPATDVGTLGPDVRTFTGALNSQGGAALYKFTLGAGQSLWRLGLQLDADRIGSPLLGALTVYDQQGQVVATTRGSQGLRSNPNDPYLFLGLQPGTYYVGVSAAGSQQVDGAFQLGIVADPATAPTRVTGFALDWTDGAPTGFTIAFSDSIAPSSFSQTHLPLYVVDRQGRMYPATLSAAGTKLSRVAFLFDQPLAPGDYSLVVPDKGGLTDLIGRTPVADGLPLGVLATWTVSPYVQAGDGASHPKTDVQGGTVTIAPGDTFTYRFVVPADRFATLDTRVAQGTLRVQRLDENGVAVVEPGSNLTSQTYKMTLQAGVYLLVMSSVGADPVVVNWTLSIDVTRLESLIDNAVGSGGALSLRLGAGQGPPAPFASSLTGDRGSETTTPTAVVMSPSIGSSAIAVLPPSLFVTVNSSLAGRPSTQNEGVSVVGASVSSGIVALASNTSGLIPRGMSANAYADDGLLRDPDGHREVQPTPASPGNEVPAPLENSRYGRAEVLEDGVQADALALIQVDRLAEAAESVSRWLFGGPGQNAEVPFEGQRLDAQILAQAEAMGGMPRAEGTADGLSTGEAERATFGVPVSVVVISAAAFRLRQLTVRWWRQQRPSETQAVGGHRTLWRGPRYMAPVKSRARATRSSLRV